MWYRKNEYEYIGCYNSHIICMHGLMNKWSKWMCPCLLEFLHEEIETKNICWNLFITHNTCTQHYNIGILCEGTADSKSALPVKVMFGFTHYGLFTPYGDRDRVNIGPGNGLLPDGTRPLPEPVLTDHQWSPVTFILGQFHKRCLNHQSLK